MRGSTTGWVVPRRSAAQALHATLADPARLASMGTVGRQWRQAQSVHEFQALLDLYRG